MRSQSRRFSLALKTLAVAAATLVMTGSAQAQTARTIYMENACRHPIKFLIHHSDTYRNWHPHGWWNFRAFQGSTQLVLSSQTLTQLDDHDLYFYAESTDGSGVYWQGDATTTTFNGVTYRLQKSNVTLDHGRLLTRVTCDGR